MLLLKPAYPRYADCDIASLKPSESTRTNFVTCYEVYTVADYFALSPLTKIALDTLTAEFNSKLGPIQLQYEFASDWLPELCEAIRLVYADTPLSDRELTPIRAAFVGFCTRRGSTSSKTPSFPGFWMRRHPRLRWTCSARCATSVIS